MVTSTKSHLAPSSPRIVEQFRHLSWLLLPLSILTISASVSAHGGHGNEFGSQAGSTGTNVQIDLATAQQLGIKTVAAKKQSLNVEIAATGQIELLPSKKVEVTAPIKGKILQLLVLPGARVKAGQILVQMSSPELNELRTSSLEKRSTAIALLQQAQTDRNLAQQSYSKIVDVATAETNQARSQLTAAQSRLAQERYQKDLELSNSGALARRQLLESKSKLASARTGLVKAQSQPGVSQSETELRKAEIDLPLRELRDAEKQVAEANGQLAKAMNQKSVVEANAQVQKSTAAVTAAQIQLGLSDANYQGRLAQLGNRANVQGIVTITAPIDGTIADREITIGQSVADAGAKLMTITDDRQVLVTANIYERDLGRLKIGQQVSVKVPGAGDRVFSGQISRIGTAVDPQSRVVAVQATLANSNGSLKAGTFAEIKLATSQVTTPVVVIPASAVVEANSEKLVYVKSGDGYQPTTVTLGQTVGNLVEVKAGLFAGDLVVSQRAPQLYAQSLKSKPVSEHGVAAKPNAASQSQIPPYLGWGLVPVIGMLGGGAFLLGKRSERNATSSVDSIKSAEELPELSATDILLLEEATEDRVHSQPESESVRIDR
jgi:membrane fusion protein, heavy metal efflux system